MNASTHTTMPGRSSETYHERTIAFQGYSVHAPGFDVATFKRAISHALGEGVRLAPAGQPGVFHAMRPGSSLTYTVSLKHCTCRAGQNGRQCKHAALAALLMAIADRPRGP